MQFMATLEAGMQSKADQQAGTGSLWLVKSRQYTANLEKGRPLLL
jgi:hypothetical protein